MVSRKIEMETSWKTSEAESVLLAGQNRAEGDSTIQIRVFGKKIQNGRDCFEENTMS